MASFVISMNFFDFAMKFLTLAKLLHSFSGRYSVVGASDIRWSCSLLTHLMSLYSGKEAENASCRKESDTIL